MIARLFWVSALGGLLAALVIGGKFLHDDKAYHRELITYTEEAAAQP